MCTYGISNCFTILPYSRGYFIEPTIVQSTDPKNKLMAEVHCIYNAFYMHICEGFQISTMVWEIIIIARNFKCFPSTKLGTECRVIILQSYIHLQYYYVHYSIGDIWASDDSLCVS